MAVVLELREAEPGTGLPAGEQTAVRVAFEIREPAHIGHVAVIITVREPDAEAAGIPAGMPISTG